MEEWSLDVINEYCLEHFDGVVLCEMAEGKGRVMISQKAVPQGEVIFIEPPLHIVAEEADNKAFQLVKAVIAEEPDVFDYEVLWYWTALRSLTQDQLKKGGPKVGTLRPVTEEQQSRLLCLYHDPVTEASEAVSRIVKRLGLKVSPVVVEDLLQAWILNCFEHSEDPLGYSTYFASSFASHSCGPNAQWTESDDGSHVLRCREHVAEGDEITISYLEEHVLLHSAAARKAVLQETKLFECRCDRCAPPDEESLGFDLCRGFSCVHCSECGVFHRLRRVPNSKGKGNKLNTGLQDVRCSCCGKSVDDQEAKRLLQAEAAFEFRLDEVEKHEAEMDEEQLQKLLKFAAAGIGPQHWLCDRLWELMHAMYRQTDRRVEQREVMQLRIDYQRHAYPGLSGTLGWALELQGETLLRHLGFGTKMLESDTEYGNDIAEQILPIFEESMRILGHMFGRRDESYVKVEKKYKTAKVFLGRRTNNSGN